MSKPVTSRSVTLRIPGGLDLDLVARSHGWYDLPPFAFEPAARRLSFVALHDGRPVHVSVRPSATGVTLRTDGPPEVAKAFVRRVLDLDTDLEGFHAACRARSAEGFGWIAERRAGRILRAPTLFEDAVKVLATTNCSWSLTRAMVTNLIRLFDRGGAFPDAPFLAGLTEERLRSEGKLGYRAPFLLRLADGVASGRLDLQRWEDPNLDDQALESTIREVDGFGPYAAQTMSRLLGRHAGLGLDSWSRRKVAELRFKGRTVSDKRVSVVYRPFGRFAGLAFWLDVTRDWHDGKDGLWPA